MKLFFLITDAALASWLAFGTVCVTLGVQVFNTIYTRIIAKKTNAKIDILDKKQSESLEQMDGHVTELVKTTAELHEELGLKKGKAEEKAKMAPIIEEKVKAAKDAGKIEGIEIANGKKNDEESSNQ